MEGILSVKFQECEHLISIIKIKFTLKKILLFIQIIKNRGFLYFLFI